MANKITKLVFLLIITLLAGCSSDSGADTISGTLEFTTVGAQNLQINANNIRATITVVSAGGGGAGGVGYNSASSSTGGGGGGGAGEVKTFTDVSLQGNTLYTVTVGQGGARGIVGNGGIDGQDSKIALGLNTLFSAVGGKGGKSKPNDSMTGGIGGVGFPNGSNGTNGAPLNVSGTALAGFGGSGGDNTSTHGRGGTGGNGTSVNGAIPGTANTGIDGDKGYVKVEWTGTSN